MYNRCSTPSLHCFWLVYKIRLRPFSLVSVWLTVFERTWRGNAKPFSLDIFHKRFINNIDKVSSWLFCCYQMRCSMRIFYVIFCKCIIQFHLTSFPFDWRIDYRTSPFITCLEDKDTFIQILAIIPPLTNPSSQNTRCEIVILKVYNPFPLRMLRH